MIKELEKGPLGASHFQDDQPILEQWIYVDGSLQKFGNLSFQQEALQTQHQRDCFRYFTLTQFRSLVGNEISGAEVKIRRIQFAESQMA